MCLSTVFTYKTNKDEAEELCSNISNVSVNNNTITCTDLLGETYVIDGHIHDVDLVKSRIYVAV